MAILSASPNAYFIGFMTICVQLSLSCEDGSSSRTGRIVLLRRGLFPWIFAPIGPWMARTLPVLISMLLLDLSTKFGNPWSKNDSITCLETMHSFDEIIHYVKYAKESKIKIGEALSETFQRLARIICHSEYTGCLLVVLPMTLNQMERTIIIVNFETKL